jgi:hypothetical protein
MTEHMADPTWIKKTLLHSLLLAAPAFALLSYVWLKRDSGTGRSSSQNMALWAGLVLILSYACWFLNVTFEWSVIFMIVWPLLGILLAIFGCVSGLVSQHHRMKLLVANALLLILALSSVIAPN